MPEPLYAFANEDEFDRARKAIRFSERLMRETGQNKNRINPAMTTSCVVKIGTPAGNGYYHAIFMYLDNETLEWEEGEACYVVNLIDSSLDDAEGAKFVGMISGSHSDGTSIVSISTCCADTGVPSGSASGDDQTPVYSFWVVTDVSCNPDGSLSYTKKLITISGRGVIVTIEDE